MYGQQNIKIYNFYCGSDKVVTDLHRILGLQRKYYRESSYRINYTLRKDLKMCLSTYPTPEL